MNISSVDEVGYMANAFNMMLDSLQKRDEANKRLVSTIIKGREEWVATFDAIDDLIAIVDKDDNITRANRALSTRIGMKLEEIVGKNCCEFFYGKDANFSNCPHKKALAAGEVITEVYDYLSMPGIFHVTIYSIFNEDGEVISSVHVARDITEETRLKDRLVHTEKMSSIGKFVAGIAHELNNPLMGIMGFTQLLLEMPGEKKLVDVRDKLTKIYNESTRTAKLVQGLLTFGREKKSEKRLYNINDIIKDTVELERHHLDSNSIGLVMKLETNLLPVFIDTYQMQQVFINIINNAIDAMVHAGAVIKMIEIETRLEKRHVLIIFKDSGPGIPDDIKAKIFDPFFTTKEVGKGTGLGLSISHGIIEEHGGDIVVDSPLNNGGTVFTISLPVAANDRGAAAPQKKPEPVLMETVCSDKTILIVDDESSIREALSQSLEYEGFKVETATDGFCALELLANKRFDVVITDIKMPNMNGMELYSKIADIDQRLKDKIILLTGDVLSRDIKEFLQNTGAPYMLKPFDPRELVELINKVLL
ncbi:MAG: response regulator [Deltaproteobacteria bacterium]|nr:response regulator [Deltaproteobacteria bacterium]